ncbi:multicopper oxidase domain-containing protein [Polynucleobacter paneuropaeus]|nr:multicopper oxidase domain-containing protein [Polynucleobacter paneuropaeus]
MGIDRRHFLRLSATLASGVVVPASFTACSREEGVSLATPKQTFVQPTMLEAKNGLLDVTLTASYFDRKLAGDDPSKKYPVSLRAYGYDNQGPSYSGPTLVVRGGDQLRVKLVNNLPVNPPFAAFRDLTNYMKPNTTNLHTHGLHVYPGIYSDRKPLEYGDYVVDPNSGGVLPNGDSRQYVYQIPKDHPEGPFYYHPQYHGSSAIQVASLMSGVIMVRGPADDLPEMAQAEELIFLFQAPYFASSQTSNNYGVKDGLLEKFAQIANHPTGHGIHSSKQDDVDSQPVLINGVRQPTIVMQSGEVQRWRFINTQVFNYLNLSLDGHTLNQYTTDGWGSSTYQEYPDARKKNGGGILLAAGNRSSVVIQAGEPGTYLLRSLPVKIAKGLQTAILPGDVLAKIVVLDSQKVMALPATPLPVCNFLKPITDQELACAGGKKRSIILNMIGNESLDPSRNSPSLINQTIASAETAASEITEFVKKNIALAKEGISKVTGKPIEGSKYFLPFVFPTYDYQLQPANTIIQNVILGSIEEWTIFNCNSIAHSFHIHVNPMYIIKINGESINPYWCDTVALPAGGTPEMPTSVTFRMRFKDFVGPYILHSQMLQYSDLGMVQRVTAVPA